MEKLNQLQLLVGCKKKCFHNQIALDEFFAEKILFAVDWRVQRWLRLRKQASIALTQVNDNVLKFEDLLKQVLNGAFQMNLPASFKKVVNSSKTAAAKETKHATAGNEGVGSSGNKKKHESKNSNGILVNNSVQDKDFALATGKSWKDTFSKQFPQDRPSWEGKVKMCARWHIKGNCYDNCARVTSHVTKDKIPPNKYAGFLTFMKKCRKAAKTRNDSLGRGPAASNHQKKRPTFCSLLGLKQVWASPASINVNHTPHPHQKKSAFRHSKIHQHQLHGSQRQHQQWQEQQGQQQHTRHPRRKKPAFRYCKIGK